MWSDIGEVVYAWLLLITKASGAIVNRELYSVHRVQNCRVMQSWSCHLLMLHIFLSKHTPRAFFSKDSFTVHRDGENTFVSKFEGKVRNSYFWGSQFGFSGKYSYLVGDIPDISRQVIQTVCLV
mgnify:CR=1 FL=1